VIATNKVSQEFPVYLPMQKLPYGFAIVVLTVISVATPAYARQWTEFFNNGSRTAWVDVDSIKGMGSTREFWVRSIYKEETIGYVKHTSSIQKSHINCDTQKIGVSKTILYNSVGSVVFSSREIDEPVQWRDTVPDSLGESMLITVCKMRDPKSDVILRSRSSSNSGTAVTQAKAVDLVQQWLQAKQRLFAPPYDREIAAKLTTGKLYQDLTSSDGSIDWLEKNDSYYQYGRQSVENIKRFSANENSFIVVASIIESSTFFNGQTGTKKSNSAGRSTIRYEFVKVNNSWLLKDYQILKQ
jgi:hypothetical protein